MPIPFTRRFGTDQEPMSLLAKALTFGLAIAAGAYFVFLYWFTH